MNRRMSLCAIIISNGFAAAAFALLQPVMSLRLGASGTPATIIGVVVSVWSIGIIAGSPFYSEIIHRLGALPSLFFGLIATGVLIFLFPIFPNWIAWAIFQFMLGLMFGHFWVLSEAWINVVANPDYRARTIAFYVMALIAGGSIGPLVLEFVDAKNDFAFYICAAMLIVGCVPLFVLRNIEPDIDEEQPPQMFSIIKRMPVLLIVALVAGFIDQAPSGMLSIYIFKETGTGSLIPVLLMCIGLGRAAFILPIGYFADKFSNMKVLLISSVLCMTLACMVPFALNKSMILLALFFLWGATFDAFYALGIALIGEQCKNSEVAVANTAFVVLHSIGGFGGTALVGLSMDRLGNIGYVVSIAAIVALLPLSLGAKKIYRETRLDAR
jgi:predicted MFS family arabinose efflux permease